MYTGYSTHATSVDRRGVHADEAQD